MSSLQFNRIRICSETEQGALELTFHPHRNLLWGPNGAGKSAILKSVFRAFDANPHGELPGWDYAAIVAVDFEIDGLAFTTVRRGDLHAMFSGERLIGAATSSSEWNAIFAKVAGFELHLVDRKGQFRHAGPANFFLPFFINQDGSFGKAWETFDSYQQFQSPASHALEYFANVRPPRYFELKAGEQQVKSKQAELKVEMTTLQRTRARLRRNLKTTPIKISEKEFQTEIRELTDRLSGLSKQQDDLRRHIVEDQDLVTSLTSQIRLSNAALKEHAADFKVAAEVSADEHKFVCPTCHAEHDDSFHTFLGLAEDARELSVLTTRLDDMLESTKQRLERNRRRATALKEDYASLQDILSKKRGRFTFNDYVQSRSAYSADAQLETEEKAVGAELEKYQGELRSVKAELKRIGKEHDSEAPLAAFRDNFKNSLVTLDVEAPEGLDVWRLATRPSASGSRYARAIIAYYAALWKSIARNESLPSPLVIDSPNQGAQDKKHLAMLLTSIAAKAPSNAQVFLAHEEQPDEFKADKVFALSDKVRLFDKKTFEKISPQMFFYVEAARANFAGVDASADDEIDDGVYFGAEEDGN